MRDVSLGCGQINNKISSMVNCTPEEAEQLKFGDDRSKLSPEDLTNIVSSVVSDWCTEIRRALDFFYSTYPDDQIKTIILSGGGGNIKEFRQLLAAIDYYTRALEIYRQTGDRHGEASSRRWS